MPLAGAPLTSEAFAKTQLKAAVMGLPAQWPELLAWTLPLAAVGTGLLMLRFLLLTHRAGAGGGAAPRSRAASLEIGKRVCRCASGHLPNASPGGRAAHLAGGGRLVVACAHRHGGGVAGGVIRSLRIAAGAGACA